MLTLHIENPASLTASERRALVALFSDADAAPVVLSDAVVRRPVRAKPEIEVVAVVPPATIAEADRPDVGALPPVPEAPLVPMTLQTWADTNPATLDPSRIFGGAAAPIPPTPPAPGASPETALLPGSVPVPTAGVPPVGAELDAKGLPWDTRIHASTKGRNTDGGWKKRKNTPDDTIRTVEAELRALMGIPRPAAMPLPPGTVVGDQPVTFPELMGWVSKQVGDKKLTHAEVVEVVGPLGASSIVGLSMRPDLIPEVLAKLKERAAVVAAEQAAAAGGVA